MVDRDDDLKLGLKTSAITFGRFDVLVVMLCYAVYLAGLTWIGRERQMGPLYYVGVLAASLIALWHYRLIRKRDRAGCFRAFLGNHWLGLCRVRRHRCRLCRATAPRRHGGRGERATGRAPLQRGLPPVLDAATRVLILGSFPGAPRWPRASTTRIRAIISGRCSARCSTSPLADLAYARRLAALRAASDRPVGQHRALRAPGQRRRGDPPCGARRNRAGTAPCPEARAGLLQRARRPRGSRRSGATLATRSRVLPSSSPAYTLPFADKLAAWREALGAGLRNHRSRSAPESNGDRAPLRLRSKPMNGEVLPHRPR